MLPERGAKRCRVQGAGYRVQGAGCRVQGAGYRVQGTGDRGQGTGYGAQSTAHWPQATDYTDAKKGTPLYPCACTVVSSYPRTIILVPLYPCTPYRSRGRGVGAEAGWGVSFIERANILGLGNGLQVADQCITRRCPISIQKKWRTGRADGLHCAVDTWYAACSTWHVLHSMQHVVCGMCYVVQGSV